MGINHRHIKAMLEEQLPPRTMFQKWFPTAILVILVMIQGPISSTGGCRGSEDPSCPANKRCYPATITLPNGSPGMCSLGICDT
ncbi:hypothetical protein C8R44DRAFT_987885 [Mycena epipterygia]|nr:hypothetical protein C8R44DRAFT_987885 [Mycena epipterygia]